MKENIERLLFRLYSDVCTSVFDIFVYFYSHTCGNDFDIGAKAAKSFETHA